MEKTREIKKLYNLQFEKYSKNQNRYKPAIDIRRKMYKLLGNVSQKNILFAGCGDGTECTRAIKMGAKVTGIDISDKAIELAKEKVKGKDISFHVVDFEKTDFRKNSFDIIVSLFSVNYKENLDTVMREFSRILKNDGFILIVVPHPIRKMIKYNKMNYFIKGWKFETWRGTKRWNFYRLIEDYFDSFIKAGFKVIKLVEPKPIKERRNMPNKEINHPYFLIFKLAKDV